MAHTHTLNEFYAEADHVIADAIASTEAAKTFLRGEQVAEAHVTAELVAYRNRELWGGEYVRDTRTEAEVAFDNGELEWDDDDTLVYVKR